MSVANNRRILLVDDELDIGRILRRVLERAGIKVDFYSDPKEALKDFKKDYYDLAILDIRMPGISGTELYEKIKLIDTEIAVCFISAYEMTIEELRKILPDYIQNCLLSKPIQNEKLVARVLAVLSGS